MELRSTRRRQIRAQRKQAKWRGNKHPVSSGYNRKIYRDKLFGRS